MEVTNSIKNKQFFVEEYSLHFQERNEIYRANHQKDSGNISQ